MTNLELMKMDLEYHRVRVMRKDLEYRHAEMLDQIAKVEKNIEEQKKREDELLAKLEAQKQS